MIRKGMLAMVFLAASASFGYAAILDGKTYEVEFQSESPQKAAIEFKDGMIVSPIHKSIMEREKALMEEASGRTQPLIVPPGAGFDDQELPEGINFNGRIEGFPPIYWSGWVKGAEIEGTINVESYDGGYMIPFKGTEK
jgi:hypothetical protein